MSERRPIDQQQIESLLRTIDKLEAEVERLREALEDIVANAGAVPWYPLTVARQALNPEPKK